MKLHKCFVIIVLIIAMAAGCSVTTPTGTQRIVPPGKVTLSIYGTWKVESCLDSNFGTLQNADMKKWIGVKAEFSNHTVRFGDF